MEQIDRSLLSEPGLIREERAMLVRGIDLFNEGRFWEAHEAWEWVWLRRPEESRIFFQGLIQAAAGYHLAIERPRISGAIKNLEKAMEKLEIFPSRFLGINVRSLLKSIRRALAALGEHKKEEYTLDEHLLPRLEAREVSTPDGHRAPQLPRA